MGSGRSEELKGKGEFWKKSYNPPEAKKGTWPWCPVPRQMRGRGRAWPRSPNTSHSALLTNRRCQHTPAGSGVGNRCGPGTAGLAMQKKQQGRLRVRSAWGHRNKPHECHAGNTNGAGGTGHVVLFPGPMCLQGAQSKTLFCKLRSKLPELRPQPRVLTAGRPEFQSGQGSLASFYTRLS